ncbi:hypothetical protein AOLI_G00211820 [Acnodon oligacanthus]
MRENRAKAFLCNGTADALALGLYWPPSRPVTQQDPDVDEVMRSTQTPEEVQLLRGAHAPHSSQFQSRQDSRTRCRCLSLLSCVTCVLSGFLVFERRSCYFLLNLRVTEAVMGPDAAGMYVERRSVLTGEMTNILSRQRSGGCLVCWCESRQQAFSEDPEGSEGSSPFCVLGESMQ